MSEDPLSPDALVVRGGIMMVVPMRLSLETCNQEEGFYGLSFLGDNDLSVEEICELAGPRLRHTSIRVSTVGRLRERGFEPFRRGWYPHLTIKFEVSPTDDELRLLAGAFDEPIPKPGSEG